MPFSITPLLDMPPPEAQEFPNFIQFQEDGTDLGSNDADTLNFAGGLTATRGTGENANVVTVAGAGGSSSTGALILIAPSDPPSEERMLFDGNPFLIDWTPNQLITSADWEWVSEVDNSHLHIITAGVYRLTMTCFLNTDNYSSEWPDGNSTYGSTVDGVSTSAQARNHTTGDPEDLRNVMTWTDQHVIVADADNTYFLGVYAKATATTTPVLPGMTIVVERLGSLDE